MKKNKLKLPTWKDSRYPPTPDSVAILPVQLHLKYESDQPSYLLKMSDGYFATTGHTENAKPFDLAFNRDTILELGGVFPSIDYIANNNCYFDLMLFGGLSDRHLTSRYKKKYDPIYDIDLTPIVKGHHVHPHRLPPLDWPAYWHKYMILHLYSTINDPEDDF